FAPESDVELAVDGTVVTSDAADSDGAVTFDYTSTDLDTGEHPVTLSSPDGTADTTFTVTDDPITYDPDASVDPTE
ncbi:hypothetical protein, partial [Phytoactinopolyspora endophytica]|uniref:hypothetical protein n=1 Tax=Phytoactinopolyspora endophytica TaxID=1642495 RepID=UPI00197C522B